MTKTQQSPYKIGSTRYYTIRQFADVTNRTVQSVRYLIAKGNRIRQLKCERIGGRPYIPATELTEFVFTLPGANGGTYRFNAKGEIVEYIQNDIAD